MLMVRVMSKVEIEVKRHSLGNYNVYRHEQKVHDEELDCEEEIMILMIRRPS